MMTIFWIVYCSWFTWYMYNMIQSSRWSRKAKHIYQGLTDHFFQLEVILASEGQDKAIEEWRRSESLIEIQMTIAAKHSAMARFYWRRAFYFWMRKPQFPDTTGRVKDRTP